jgi:parallel beta-helix repeat protein
MTRTKNLFIFSSTIASAILTLLGFIHFIQAQAVHASPGTHYVAHDGNCGTGYNPCYVSIQGAVDDAIDGDTIKVATGVYSGVNNYGGLPQVVYISKTITIRGGYSAGSWDYYDPDVYSTTLDAQGLGRVMYITGNISPTIEGLHITGGDANGLGGSNPPYERDGGGGLLILDAWASIKDTRIFSNTAQEGGGLLLYSSSSELNKLDVYSNTAEYYGGGIYMYLSPATLRNNQITDNRAHGNWSSGGGLFISYSDVVLEENTIAGNTSVQIGGGIYLHNGEVTMNSNSVSSNESIFSNGGGMYIYSSQGELLGNNISDNVARYEGGGLVLFNDSNMTLNRNTIISNTAGRSGGGLDVRVSSITMTNNVVADNYGRQKGSGILAEGTQLDLLYTTIARNTGDEGDGVHVTGYTWGTTDYSSTINLHNNILVSHTVGITVTGGNTVTAAGILWYNTPLTVAHAATATVTLENQHTGDPAFSIDGYHLTEISAAINKGQSNWVSFDLDGEPRFGAPDLGADEYWLPGEVKRIYLPISLR